MANNRNIPAALELEIRQRDRQCVYCQVLFGSDGTRRTAATWEHIINDVQLIDRTNIALCCTSCNASKGAKDLADLVGIRLLPSPRDYLICRLGCRAQGVGDLILLRGR